MYLYRKVISEQVYKYRKSRYLKKKLPGNMNKKGQFYIVTALFIVLILFGTTTISTYTLVKPEPRTIYNIGSELDRETYHIIEYGTFSRYNRTQLTNLSRLFWDDDISSYFLDKTNNANIVFLYGNKSDLEALRYRVADFGTISIGGVAAWNIHGDYSEKIMLMMLMEMVLLKLTLLMKVT